MKSAPEDFAALRFSTDDFPARERDEAFREVYGRTIMRLEFEPLPGIPFSLNMQLRATRDFGMSSGVSSPVNCRRSTALIDGDDLIFVTALKGGGLLRTSKDETGLNAGQAVLTDSSKAGTFTIGAPSTLINLRFSSARLTPLLADIDKALMRPVPQSEEALRLLIGYAGSMSDDLALASPELRALLVAHFYDLAALALGAKTDAAAFAHRRGAGAARLHSIKADVVANIAQRDLSAAAIAKRHGVSKRYVNMLFEDETETLSEFVLRQRLLRAYRMLTDPRLRNRTISSIAYQAGFGDLSYFNRCFRRRFGATPSDVRATLG